MAMRLRFLVGAGALAFVRWRAGARGAAGLRAEGFATVAALDACEPMAEARRLGCTFMLDGQNLIALD